MTGAATLLDLHQQCISMVSTDTKSVLVTTIKILIYTLIKQFKDRPDRAYVGLKGWIGIFA